LNSSSEEVARRRIDNVDILLMSVQRALTQGGNTLSDAVAQLQLQDRLDQQGDERNAADCVQLMTLHAAKGLEFPHVFMVGVEENLLPHRSSVESGDLAEERRLAYVGITRAQRKLTLSYAQQRRQMGRVIECSPSRFLEELPMDELVWHGRNSEASEKERASETLASLKALLG
jgi:ATP-dependent DNA helicase Rep